MTRRLLAFFAPGMLMAQTKAKPHYTTGRMCLATEADDCQTQRPRPRNGQCPQCGTMAKPYVIPTGPTICDAIGAQAIFPNGNLRQSVKECNVRLLSRRIDCVFCNTTFRQWAEGKEPK